MVLSGEDRSRIYEEDRVREEAREEIQREGKQKQASLGSRAIIAIVLAVGLPVILLGCGESTPETTAKAAAETAPAPGSSLSDAAQARLPRGVDSYLSAAPAKMLEFATLRERPMEGGGIDVEILVDEASSKRDVRILGEYILWRVWPKKHFTVLVYDNNEAWEARGLCEQAHQGESAAKLDEIEGGPICTRATQLEEEHLLLSISRNPSAFQAESLWIGPDRQEVLSDAQ